MAAMAICAQAQEAVPVTLDIADEAAFASWTVIDQNATESPNSWAYGAADAIYSEDKDHAANDWLISPAVQLEGGVTYAIDYYLVQKSFFFSDKQKYEITVGMAPTVEAQVTQLAIDESFSSKLYTKQTVKFTPSESGTYYLGVHLFSDKYQGDCGFQKFVVSQSTEPADDQPDDGPKTIPYSEDFSTCEAFDEFTTITNVSRSWTYSSYNQCAEFWGAASPVDVWLITPDIDMQQGKAYKMTFRTGLENAVNAASYKHLYVSVGAGASAQAQTVELWDELIQSALMERKTVYFSVPTDGLYNMGFRVQGETSVYAIFVDEIDIVETIAGDLNGDGAVDVSDVNLLINVVLGKSPVSDLKGTADLNGDGAHDVSDVNAVINIILRK